MQDTVNTTAEAGSQNVTGNATNEEQEESQGGSDSGIVDTVVVTGVATTVALGSAAGVASYVLRGGAQGCGQKQADVEMNKTASIESNISRTSTMSEVSVNDSSYSINEEPSERNVNDQGYDAPEVIGHTGRSRRDRAPAAARGGRVMGSKAPAYNPRGFAGRARPQQVHMFASRPGRKDEEDND